MPDLTPVARRLRRKQTDVERLLWSRLRDRRLGGWKFRRQMPIGPYVADFACFKAKLIIELDGGQHQSKEKYDSRRTEFLHTNGWEVVRFWNNEFTSQEEEVLTVILQKLQSLMPSP